MKGGGLKKEMGILGNLVEVRLEERTRFWFVVLLEMKCRVTVSPDIWWVPLDILALDTLRLWILIRSDPLPSDITGGRRSSPLRCLPHSRRSYFSRQ